MHKTSRHANNDEFKAILSFSCRTFWSSLVIVYSLCVFTLVSIHIFTFGNFNNFATLQNLTFPLIIAIITLVLLKLTKDYLKPIYHDHIKEYHNQNNDLEEAEEGRCQKEEITSNSARDDTNSASNDTNFSNNYPDSTLMVTSV